MVQVRFINDTTPIDVTSETQETKISVKSENQVKNIRVKSQGTDKHNELYNRDLPDQHPISAITGLQDALDSIPTDYVSDAELEAALLEKQDVIRDLSEIRQGAALGATAVQPSDLESYATTQYVDNALNAKANVADIPTATSDLLNDSGFITLSALTPYATQNWVENKGYLTEIPAEYVTDSELTAKGYQTAADVETAITAKGYTTMAAVESKGYITGSALVGYATENYVTTSITNEATVRQNADNNLQSQIDVITASSDVTDIVGTYAELQNYDTSTLAPNSIIKVLQDESRNNATTYYRWVITQGVWAWSLIGEEGPYYTISAADGKFATQTSLANGLSGKQDIISDLGAIRSGSTLGSTAVQPSDLATVATSGSYNDLSNKPSIPAAQVNSDWNATSGVAQILNKPSLATVATSGAYADLSGTPTIPTVNDATLTIQKNGASVATFTANASTNATANITVPTDTGDLTNGAGFITGITSGDVTTALGYTPYSDANPNGYTSNVGTVTSVNNTSPDGNGNVTLSIPTVNNPTITITQGGVTKGSFTLNQASGDTIALDAGGGGAVWGGITGDIDNQTDLKDALDAKADVSSLATVATTGDYDDLINKPTIPAAQVNSDWTANTGVAQILNKPTLGTMAAESASDYTKTSGLATVATSGLYSDLSGTPTIPTVNNATISFTQGGVSKGSITLNQATDQMIALDAGGGSYTAGTGIDITNDVISVAAPTLVNNTTKGLSILGTSSNTNNSTSIGKNASATGLGSLAISDSYGTAGASGMYGTCVGGDSSATGTAATAFGSHAKAKANYAIQLGYGTNSEANSFYVATSASNNWKMLGSDGKIPAARLPIAAHVVETYSNGADWYRVWSDGWCEQGGSATGDGKSGRTVSLLKTYSDTNYNIQAEITDYTSSNQKIVSIGSKTASDFKAYTSTTSGWGSYAFDWTACGYIN